MEPPLRVAVIHWRRAVNRVAIEAGLIEAGLISVLAILGGFACAFEYGASGVSGQQPGAFYVSVTGSDQNPGSLSHPFLTLEKARSAMRESGTVKTTYLRAGVYHRTRMLILTSADDGETWSYYPADGFNSAILDASGITFQPCRASNIIFIQGGSNITIDGLKLTNFHGGGGITIHGGAPYPDMKAGSCFVYSGTGASHGNVVTNTIIRDLGAGADNRYPWGWFAGIAAWGDVKNTTIRNNVIHDVGAIGVFLGVLQMGPSGGLDNCVIRRNVVFNTNRSPTAGDLGGIL